MMGGAMGGRSSPVRSGRHARSVRAASARDEDRRVVVADLIAAVSGEAHATAVAGFLDAVGTERWWSGVVCLRVGHPDGEVLLLPGSDGAFLHLVYPAEAAGVRQAVSTALAAHVGG